MSQNNLKIFQFVISAHLPMLTEWLRARKQGAQDASEVPELTYVAYCDDTPTAMGSLRRVEGGFALLDGLCTNPAQPGEIRGQAIDLLVSHLLKTAQTIGIKSVLAYTSDENTLMRSKHHGFVQLPHTLIVAKTTGE